MTHNFVVTYNDLLIFFLDYKQRYTLQGENLLLSAQF